MPTPNLAKAEAGQAAAAESTKVETAAPSSSLPGNGNSETIDSRIEGADSPEAVLKLLHSVQTDEVKPGEVATPEGAVAETGAEKPAGGEDGEGTAAPAGDQTTKVEGEQTEEEKKAAADQAKAEADEAERQKREDGEGGDQLPERIRLTNFQNFERLALQLKRDDPKLSLAEAEKRAKAALGIKDKAPTEEKTPATDPNLPKTLAESTTKLKELKAQRSKAMRDIDLNLVADLDEKIEAMGEHAMNLREAETAQAGEAQRKYESAFASANTQASGLYDFVKQPDSAAYKRMGEIDRALEENGDALFHDPSKPLKIAQMVASELNIAPKSKTAAPAKPVIAAPPKVPARVPPPVASGASRTSTPTTQGGQIDAEIDKLTTPEEIEAFMQRVGSG